MFSVDNLSFDDIMSMSGDSLDDNLLDGEEELIVNLTNTLEEGGYHDLDELSYDQLLYLKSRMDDMNNPSEINNIVYNAISSIKSAITTLATSKATLNSTDYDKDKSVIDKLKSGQVPSEISDTNLNVIFTIINNLYNDMDDPDELTVDVVYDYLSANTDINLAEIEDNQEIVFNYLESVVNQIVTMRKHNLKKNKDEKTSRKVLADYLLRDELDLVNKFWKTYRDEDNIKINFIKQIYNINNEFYFKCPNCGEMVKIGKIIATYIAFPTEKSRYTDMFIKIFHCNCGWGSIFADKDYKLLKKSLEGGIAPSINQFVDKLSTFSKGASNLRVKVPSSIIPDVFEALIVGSGEKSDSNINKEPIAKYTNMDLKIGDDEFKMAVRQFYSRLQGMYNKRDILNKSTTTVSIGVHDAAMNYKSPLRMVANKDYTYNNRAEKNRLSYSEIAYYICNMLSKDYVATKNSAMFSLLFSLSENRNISEYINCSAAWDLKATIALLDGNINIKPEAVPIEIMSELVAIDCFYSSDIAVVDRKIDLTNREFKKSVFESLKTKVPILKERVHELERTRSIIIQNLSRCKEALSYTNIYNMSQYKTIDFDCIVNDEEMFALVDEISDRMIINYYAEDFYNVWVSMHIVNTSNLNNILTNFTDNRAVRESLGRLLQKMFKSYNINIDLDTIDRYFYMTYQLSQNKLKELKDLSVAFNKGNYYRFCKVLAEMPINANTLLSHDFTTYFNSFVGEMKRTAINFIERYPTEQDYYLSQFTQDEIAMIDFETNPIKFSRYLPKRLEGESIINYINRYKELSKESSLNRYNSLDYGKGFTDLYEWYPLIYSCSLLYNIEYHSFAVGTFMCQLLNLIVDFGDRNSKLPILGITESILNILDNSLYVIDPNSLNMCDLEAQYKVLFGTYFTSIGSKIESLRNEYSYEFLNVANKLGDSTKKFNFETAMNDIKGLDDSFYIDEETGNNDYEEAMIELRSYVGNNKKYSKMLE